MDKQILSLLREIKGQLDEQREVLSKHSEQLEQYGQILQELERYGQCNQKEHENMAQTITSIKEEIVELGREMSKVEMITASNWYDIAKLKLQNE